ncbi:Penicillin-binding protein 2 (PBP-2) [hydrothermal vent metagenome]|uniref:Penicillin-binding protein 2 (PBP-2) n=1 Tax=hydrothermal vent metagenome TaxID=652676 RepID=A0A1W1CJP5_9ZZZZ
MQELSNTNYEERIFSIRIIVAVIMMFVLTSILLINLVKLQIVNYQYYLDESDGNRYTFESIEPQRGRIFDRNGEILADNQLSFFLIIVPKQVKDINKTLKKLLDKKIISSIDIKNFHKNIKKYKSYQEIVLAKNLNEKRVAIFSTLSDINGINIRPVFTRIYYQSKSMAHIVGYVSLMSRKDKQEYNSKEYKSTTHIGKLGIEKQYERILHGFPGKLKVEKNIKGQKIHSKTIVYPTKGDDLYLTIDSKLQKKANEVLKGRRGAIVVVDVRNGDVLAAVSQPSFDTNLFVNGISYKDYNRLIKSKDKPLFNRFIKGTYPPGSTVKPFVALAGLTNNKITINKKIFAKGYYQIPKHQHKYRDWKRGGHGWVNVKDALARSVDVYFYDVAYRLGIDKLHKYLSYFGFGKKTGIDINGELAGILPSREWKKNNKNKPWYLGETVITGIGQGFFTATPLQLSIATAALANKGILYQPRLLKGIGINGEQTNNKFSLIPIKNIKNWNAVLEGMKQTIYGKKGTARRLNNRYLKYTLAGKTGTAQVFGLDPEEEYISSKLDERLRDHALFTGFAPYENPEVAIAVIVENAGSGSSKAAPLAKKVLDVYFKNKL